MELWLLLLVAFALIAVALLVVRRRRTRPTPPPPATATAGSTTIEMRTEDRDGATVATLIEERGPDPRELPWYRRIGRMPLGRTLALALLAVLVALGGTWLYNELNLFQGPGPIVVAVAPFADAGDGQTGRNVAAALAQQIQRENGGLMQVVVLGEAPADAPRALALAGAAQADMLVWGQVEAGAVLESPSLRPRLIYTPRPPRGPDAWDGYTGRFVMPRSFTIAREPINGAAVVPALLRALADYNRGNPDAAFNSLGELMASYPLAAPLPRSVRGNVLWARGALSEAAEEYRLALGEPSDDQAFLANNLGAILLDAGDPAALSAFEEATRLLGGNNLGALRFNLGLSALRAGQLERAVSDLEQARNLLPPSTPLLVTLAEAYRDLGRLDAARAALADAEASVAAAAAGVPEGVTSMVRQSLQGLVREQQILVALAEATGGEGRLSWALASIAPLPPQQLGDLRDQMRSVIRGDEVALAGWRQRSAAQAAATPGTGLVANGQADRAELHLQRHRYAEALMQIEMDRSRVARGRSAVDSLFSGGRPMAESLQLLADLSARQPDNPDVLLAYARALAYSGDPTGARQRFDQAQALAPGRPEPAFGKGEVSLAEGDRTTARQLYGEALTRDGSFYPARRALARVEEEDGNFAAAAEQYRALLQQRPQVETALALARTLRRVGPPAYPEAEQALLPYTATSAQALLELGRLYNDAGRPAEAQQVFAEALALAPESAEAAYLLGASLEQVGDAAGAEQRYQTAVRLDEDYLDARLALARLYQGPLNRPSAATDQYRAALSISERQPSVTIDIGDALFAAGSYAYAAQAYEEAVRAEPDNPAVQHRLGKASLALGRVAAANQAESRVLELTAGTTDPALLAIRAEALTNMGEIQLLQGKAAEALAYFNDALAAQPGSVPATVGLGRVAVAQGNWGVALGHFEQAAARPEGAQSAEAQFWLAEALLRNSNVPRAIELYNSALAIRPLFPEAYLGLAQAYQAIGQRDAAAEAIGQAISQRPDYAEGLLFQGKLLQEQGRIDEAIGAFSASISANRQIAETYYRRGVLFLRNADYGRATEDLRRAVQLQPNFPDANYWLGQAFYARGNNRNALDAFRKAVEQNPNYTEAIFYRGLVEEDLGLREEAIASYQAVIQADGDGQWGSQARAKLAGIL